MEIYKQIKRDAGVFCIVFMFLMAIYSVIPYGRDNTDGEDRSGMRLHVDAMTGCNYLSVNGAITLRLDINGNHICES